MNITITGVSGFLGKNLFAYLKTDHEVESMRVRYVPNQSFEINSETIIHLSGKAHDLKNTANPQEYYEANLELTKQIFDSFLVSEAKVFIFMSTVKAVADEVNFVLKEDAIPNPKTHYGISKQLAEKYILEAKLPIGKRIYILRPCMIHGPSNKGNLNSFYQWVSKGIPWPLGSFVNKRSFCSIENLCFIIKELIENPAISSGIYNIADDDAIATNELIHLIGIARKRKYIILNVPVFVIKAIAKIGDCISLPLNSERLQKLTESYIVSNEKIKKAMGKPLPIDAKSGLLKTFNSFESHDY